MALRSAESTAAVHGRPGSPDRAACVFVYRFVEENTDRADADTIQGYDRGSPDKTVLHRRRTTRHARMRRTFDTVASPSIGPDPGDWTFRIRSSCISDLTSAAPPTSLLISWRGTSERCAKDQVCLVYAASRSCLAGGGRCVGGCRLGCYGATVAKSASPIDEMAES